MIKSLFIRKRLQLCNPATLLRFMTTMEGENMEFKTVKEGKADVLFPKNVFYNPVQEFNRDLTIAVMSEFSKERMIEKERKEAKLLDSDVKNKMDVDVQNADNGDVQERNKLHPVAAKKYESGIKILEGLSASGLRSIRFGLEIPGVHSIVANDYDRNAVSVIDKNIEKHNLQELVRSSCDDAAMVMYRHRDSKDRFDVIDLDPYGSPSQFLDATVQAVSDGGLLCVTCTDAAVLCGKAGETCYSKYGAMSLTSKCCHEMGVRIILQCIESHANRYSRYIVPVISLSIDFYFRVFVRVYSGQGKVKRSASKMAMVYQCTGCGSFSLQRIGIMTPTKGNNFKYSPAFGPPVTEKCIHCGGQHQFGGPIWADSICDEDFIDKVINSVNDNKQKFNTSGRIVGMLSLQKEELQDVPLYFITDELFKTIHAVTMPLNQFRSALLNAGYRVSSSHAAKNSVKTDAPHSVIWDILRTWVKDHPVKAERLTEGSTAKNILDKECTTKVSFEIHPEANPESKKQKLLRYQFNPEKYWGPKARATRKAAEETEEERQKRLQGKRAKQTNITSQNNVDKIKEEIKEENA